MQKDSAYGKKNYQYPSDEDDDYASAHTLDYVNRRNMPGGEQYHTSMDGNKAAAAAAAQQRAAMAGGSAMPIVSNQTWVIIIIVVVLLIVGLLGYFMYSRGGEGGGAPGPLEL